MYNCDGQSSHIFISFSLAKMIFHISTRKTNIMLSGDCMVAIQPLTEEMQALYFRQINKTTKTIRLFNFQATFTSFHKMSPGAEPSIRKRVWFARKWTCTKSSYYMASSGKMELSCPLGTTCSVPQENFPESRIINPFLTKLVRSRWLDIGLVLFLVLTLG